MRFRCHLRGYRGERLLREIAEASGVAQPILSQLENGRMLPADRQIPALEAAYGAPMTAWFEWRGPTLVVDMDDIGEGGTPQ